MPGLIPPLGTFAGALTRRRGLLALADQGEKAAKPLVLKHRCLGEGNACDIPIGEAGDISIGDLHRLFA